ncbi:MAG: hypothetical protein AVDCRST_MAG30-4043, partial [uncultured Solirubrobacteraceae bacterium]
EPRTPRRDRGGPPRSRPRAEQHRPRADRRHHHDGPAVRATPADRALVLPGRRRELPQRHSRAARLGQQPQGRSGLHVPPRARPEPPRADV